MKLATKIHEVKKSHTFKMVGRERDIDQLDVYVRNGESVDFAGLIDFVNWLVSRKIKTAVCVPEELPLMKKMRLTKESQQLIEILKNNDLYITEDDFYEILFYIDPSKKEVLRQFGYDPSKVMTLYDEDPNLYAELERSFDD